MKSNARSALILAVGLCAGLAAPSHAAARDNGHAAIMVAQAGSGAQPTNAQPPAQHQAVAPNRLTAADRALRDPDASSLAPVTATGGGHSLWSKTSLIGKIFVGIGAVLTLASAARMFMA